MNTKITVLGTGCADSTKYFQTAFFIQDEQTNFLIDAGGGSGILSQLEKSHISLNAIQNIFISHKHIDHIFGLFWILRFRGANIANENADNLAIYASAKNIELIKQVSRLFLKEKVIALFDPKILFIPIDTSPDATINDWNVYFFNTQSKKEEQFGCKITLPTEKTITFIGDEPYTDTLLPYCEHTDYLFHDAYCLEKDRAIFHPEEMFHSTAKEAGVNAQTTQAKNLILFHTEDTSTFGNRKELYAVEAKQQFSGNVFMPDDGDDIEIRDHKTIITA